ncbi:MAG: alpha/beta fold hydrolase [Mycobacteriales bacterium]
MTSMTSSDDLPRQFARTRRFSLGTPRQVAVTADGGAVLFCRSESGSDPRASLWALDVATGTERRVADPAALLATGEEHLSPDELTRRERAREPSTGITAFATDLAGRTAVFALDGRLWTADVASGEVRELPAAGPVADPCPDPAGAAVAYVTGGVLRVIGPAGDVALAEPENDEITYGHPLHVADEVFQPRGYVWAPDGTRLAVARADNTPVNRWYLADPAHPERPPKVLRYPLVGTSNALVSLWVLGLDGARVEVRWDREAYEYLVAVRWTEAGLLVTVQNRAQSVLRVLAVDPDTGGTRVVSEQRDPAWVTIVPGVPAYTAAGALVTTVDSGGARRLAIDGEPATPDGLQLREVLAVDGETVLFAGSEEPAENHVWAYGGGRLERLTGPEPGWHHGWRAGGTTVLMSEYLDRSGVAVTVHRDGRRVAEIASLTEKPVVTPRVTLLALGERELRSAVLFPTGHVPGSRRLPVLLDPYGGPARQRAIAARDEYAVPQWFADQGFAVLVTDGRGTPGRSPEWERSIHLDIADPVLADQVDALHAAAERYLDDLDLDRVGIRGWSFGGFLAAFAVLRRPDVFHAAVAGAAPVDHALYDTHWKERFLGLPAEHPEAYANASLLTYAADLSRPLMLIHGMADDNVALAHTLRLSEALVAAGRPHTVLPLPGVAHSALAQPVGEHVLRLQAHFLLNSL